jgi:hypothetical protein
VDGALDPPAPVATAEYVVFWVGVSVTEPDACELVATVRLPAVIVSEAAFASCQLRVTVCPVVMEVGVAVNDVTCAADATCTFVDCGVLVPPGPVATAE